MKVPGIAIMVLIVLAVLPASAMASEPEGESTTLTVEVWKRSDGAFSLSVWERFGGARNMERFSLRPSYIVAGWDVAIVGREVLVQKFREDGSSEWSPHWVDVTILRNGDALFVSVEGATVPLALSPLPLSPTAGGGIGEAQVTMARPLASPAPIPPPPITGSCEVLKPGRYPSSPGLYVLAGECRYDREAGAWEFAFAVYQNFSPGGGLSAVACDIVVAGDVLDAGRNVFMSFEHMLVPKHPPARGGRRSSSPTYTYHQDGRVTYTTGYHVFKRDMDAEPTWCADGTYSPTDPGYSGTGVSTARGSGRRANGTFALEWGDPQTFRYPLEGSAIDGDYQIVFTRIEWETVRSDWRVSTEVVDFTYSEP